jgi:zinc finger protein ubi-d4
MALKISSAPEVTTSMPNILKIEKLLHDSAYSELIEISANFNTRLCVERKLRMPFLDPQTGVAQKHSNLYMKKAQRMPGLKEGQIYSYPSLRWRNKRNSLKLSSRPFSFFRFRVNDNCSTMGTINHSLHTTNQLNSTNPIGDGEASDFQALIDESNSLTADTDSKDSQEVTKEWFYDDMDANDVASEEQADSDFDYNINGYKRKKKSTVRKSSRKPKETFGGLESTRKSRPSGVGSSGANAAASSGGSSRSNRSKKGSSSRSTKSGSNGSKSEKSESSKRIDMEPPSFDSVQDEMLKLNDGSADSFSSYRNY